ncbi:MAG: hypothetical protein HW421_3786 [Ignavibacteria bacterium]|nr:hypothetical protein [Ignavibacteria bacterium]
MAYSTDDDLLKEFSTEELARLSGDSTGQEIDTDRTDYAHTNADAFINSNLNAICAVPFEEPVPAIISSISIALTIANLYEYSCKNSIVPSGIVLRKIEAMRLLKDIRNGIISLNSGNLSQMSPPPIISNKTGQSALFSDDVLDQFFDK